MIRTIIFDLGKVIVPFDFERGYRRIEPYCSCPIAELPERIRATGLVETLETGRMEPRRFHEELSAALGLRVGFEQFCELWSSVFLPETLIPESLLEALHRRYPLVLLSNTNAIHFEMIRENYPILRHFDDFVLSYRVGAMKPSPRIYQEAVGRAGCAPQECFFTDDVPAYVEAARREGIDAVLFEGCAALESSLAGRGVTW